MREKRKEPVSVVVRDGVRVAVSRVADLLPKEVDVQQTRQGVEAVSPVVVAVVPSRGVRGLALVSAAISGEGWRASTHQARGSNGRGGNQANRSAH
jgi:hypothetical protein